MKFTVTFVALSFALSASARPFQVVRRAASADVQLQNGQDALTQNAQFATINADSSCDAGQNACINNGFAQCVNGKFVVQPCAAGLVCAALPLVNSAGTSIACTTQSDLDARIAATGASSDKGANNAGNGKAAGNNNNGNNKNNNGTANANNGNNANNGTAANSGKNNGDPQKSLTLLDSVIAKGFANNGQDQPAAGQVASLTSTNNFINFCATVKKPLTNGQQVKTGSCNPAPMGVIAATTNMPSAKFQFPINNGEVEANKAFTIKLAINHLETGFFTNAQESYFAAPQQVNSAGDVQGHSHVVIEKLDSISQATPTDPGKFAFFKGLNDKSQGGVLTADVTNGLDAGVYRLATINSAANHQPVLVAVAQHGTLDDMIYFTVKKGAKN